MPARLLSCSRVVVLFRVQDPRLTRCNFGSCIWVPAADNALLLVAPSASVGSAVLQLKVTGSCRFGRKPESSRLEARQVQQTWQQ